MAAMWRRGVEAAAEMLRKGLTVTPKNLAEAARLTVPENDAYHQWLTNFTRAATHEAGQALGVTIMAVGNGQGYKEPETPEELAEAKRRSEVQIRAQAGRRKEIKLQIRDLNQPCFDLDSLKEVAAGASETDTAQQPIAASE